MGRRLRTVLSASAVTVLGLMCLSAGPTNATTNSLAVTINQLQIDAHVDPTDAKSHDFVTVSGTVTNTSNSSLNDTLHLVTGSNITTRSQLADIIKTHAYQSLTPVTGQSKEISGLQPQSSFSWRFSVRADAMWGLTASGVFPIGVALDSAAISDVNVVPWFSNASTLAPTKVAVALRLTTDRHPLATASSSAAVDTEARRLARLMSLGFANASYVVDPYVPELLAQSPTQSTQTTAQTMLSLPATPSVFANANLARLAAGHQQDVINQALTLSGAQSHILYFLNHTSTNGETINSSVSDSVVTVVPNTLVTNDKNVTTNAVGQANGAPVLIYDQAASDCFSLTNDFDSAWCLNAQLSMITAESPNVSRTILLATPSNWSEPLNGANELSAQLQDTSAYEFESLSDLLDSADHNAQTLPTTVTKPFNSSLRHVASEISKSKILLSNVMPTNSAINEIAHASVVMYSQDWNHSAAAKAYGRSAIQLAHEQLDRIRLEGSQHITIPGTKAELPITVYNSSDVPATVRILVVGSTSRLSAGSPHAVTVEPKRRLTVQVPITLRSVNEATASIYLADSRGVTFGDSLTVRITSTAYQQFARSLVWIALVALVLLVANNIRRHSRSTPTE